VDLKKMYAVGMSAGIKLAQDGDQWWSFVKVMVWGPQFPEKLGATFKF
jgi:hypothetical protein